jgi:Tol biopolymer transport system component
MKNALTIFFSLSFLFASSQELLPGGKIAFLGYNSDTSSVFVMTSDGSDIQQVTPDSIEVHSFAISPDGSELVASIDGDIFIINIASGSMKKLTHNRSTYAPEWSPNGKYIAFSDRFGEYAELCVIDTGGLEYRRLTPFHTNEGNISSTWAPDSKEIAFQGRGYDFFIVNIDNPRGIRQITHTGSDKISIVARKFPSWSPDGKKIAYFKECLESGLYHGGIYIMNTDGSDPTLILELNGRAIIDWSPDSQYITYELLKDGRHDIYIINLKGEIITNLTKDTNDRNYMPSWSLK